MSDATKLSTLNKYIAPSIYEIVSKSQNYTDAVKILKDIYITPKSEVFSQHLLQTQKQRADENLDQYLTLWKYFLSIARSELSVQHNLKMKAPVIIS